VRALCLLGLVLHAATAHAATPAREPDAIAPVLFALRKAHPEGQHPRVPEVWNGRANLEGFRSVCGLVSFDGSRFSEQRFIGLVDEAALRYRGAPDLLVEEIRSATFALAWSRQCER
jgi:hypothetical protein